MSDYKKIGEALRVLYRELLCQCYDSIEIVPNPDPHGVYLHAVVVRGRGPNDNITASMAVKKSDSVEDFTRDYGCMMLSYEEVLHEGELKCQFTDEEK